MREKATAPAAVSAMRRAALSAAPADCRFLCLAGDEVAFFVPIKRHCHEIGHVRQGFSPLSRAVKSAWRSASLGFAPPAEK